MQAKEQRILAAAEEIFPKHGFEKTTVDEIIALADVGKGTLYKYFGNKEQLFYRLVHAKNVPFVERLEAAVAQSTDLEQRMIAYFQEMICFYRENAALWRIICFEKLGNSNGCMVCKINGVSTVVSLYESELSQELKDTILSYHSLLEAEYEIFQQLLEEGMQNGLLKQGDAETSAKFFFFGIAMCIFHSPDTLEGVTSEEMAKVAVDRILHGMA